MDSHATIRATSSYAAAESTRLNDNPKGSPAELDTRKNPRAFEGVVIH